MQGYDADSNGGQLIRVDQGLDTEEIAPKTGMDSDLVDDAFIVELDYRLGRIKRVVNHDQTAVNFIDDDNIASYYLTDNKYVNPSGKTAPKDAIASSPAGSFPVLAASAMGGWGSCSGFICSPRSVTGSRAGASMWKNFPWWLKPPSASA